MADSNPLPPPTRSDKREIVAALTLVALAMAVRAAMGPQLDGLDDAGYLEAAQRISHGRSVENMFPLFRTRVGMAYPFGWLLKFHVLAPGQFWVLTMVADAVTMAALFIGTRWLTGATRAAFLTVVVYAVYPFAVQQAVMFYPSAFQTMFIAIALALLCGTERGYIKARSLAALGAGTALGLAYLVKEDAALIVPAIAVASLFFGFPSRMSVFWTCVGAATIFFVESATYWVTTGSPTFRLTATSALEAGSSISNQLQISDIFRPDAYLRSLYLLPIQVGLAWWILIPSLWSAFRQGDRRLRFLAVLFLILAAYLQFGSSSISHYAPLPKTPRYTVIVTPIVMMLIGTWLADLYVSGRKNTARAVLALIVVVSIPCIAYLAITSSERSRNSLTAARALRDLPPAPLYTDYYSARGLRILAPELPAVNVWYHANFDRNEIIMQSDPNPHPGAFVLLDLQSAKIYTSSYEMTLPDAVVGAHPGWKVVWQGRAYDSGSTARRLLEFARSTAMSYLPEGSFSQRVQRSVADIIDSDQVTLYRVE